MIRFFISFVDMYCLLMNRMMSLTIVTFIHEIINRYYYKTLSEPEKDYLSISYLRDKKFIEGYHNKIPDSNSVLDTVDKCVLLTLKRFNHFGIFKHYIVKSTDLSENLNYLTNNAGVVKTSKIYFINIEYINKRLDNSIQIKLPKEYLINDNELLSRTFILRYLLYNHGSKVEFYDLDYKVIAMDNKLNIFTISYDEDLKLYDDHYIIRKIATTRP